MNDQKLLRGLLLDSLDAQKGMIPDQDLDRSRQILRSYLPRTGDTAPYEAYVMLLAEHDLMNVAKNLVEYHGPSAQILVIDAEPGETVQLQRLAFPGDIQCKGHLTIMEGVVGGRIEASRITYGHLAVGSHVEAHEIASERGESIGALNVADFHEGTTFVGQGTTFKPDHSAPAMVFSGPGETFH